jgi:uncharacterized protein
MQLYLPIAELSLNVFLLLLIGFTIGFLSGMLGIGGGFILAPILLLAGVPPAVAVGTSASQVVATSVLSAYSHWQRGNVDEQMGLLLIAGGFFGAITGVKIVFVLKALGQLDLLVSLTYVILLGVVGGLMLIESLRALNAGPARIGASARRAGQHTWIEGLPLKLRFRRSRIYASAIPPVVIGAIIGWLTAIMGVGGGFLLIPAMIYLLRIPTKVVIGTSTFQIVCVTAFATVLQSVQNHAVDLVLALPLMLGGVVGAQFGVGFGGRFKNEQLRVFLAVIVLGVAVRMAYGLVIKPADLYALEVPQ